MKSFVNELPHKAPRDTGLEISGNWETFRKLQHCWGTCTNDQWPVEKSNSFY